MLQQCERGIIMLTQDMSDLFTDANIKEIQKKFSESISQDYKNKVKISREKFLAYAFCLGKSYQSVERTIEQTSCPVKGQITFLELLSYEVTKNVYKIIYFNFLKDPLFKPNISYNLQKHVAKWLTAHLPSPPPVVKPKTYMAQIFLRSDDHTQVISAAEYKSVIDSFQQLLEEKFPKFKIINADVSRSI